MKYIRLVTDDGLYDQKAFCKVEIVYIHPQESRVFVHCPQCIYSLT